MLKHPQGYRPTLPARELALGTINALAFASGLIFTCPTLLIAFGSLPTVGQSADEPLPAPYWVGIGLALLVFNVGCMCWMFWANRNTQELQYKPAVWVIGILALIIIWVVQSSIVFQWFSLYWDD